jgi:polysaccharide export outer membrane protein
LTKVLLEFQQSTKGGSFAQTSLLASVSWLSPLIFFFRTLSSNCTEPRENTELPYRRRDASVGMVKQIFAVLTRVLLSLSRRRFGCLVNRRNLALAVAIVIAFIVPPFALSQQPAGGPSGPPSSSHHSPNAAASGTDTTASNYTLSPGDVVTIRVFREPDLDTQQRVSKEGTINYPLIGIVKIAGLSSDQASAKIAAALDKDYLVRPQVSLSVVAYSKQKFMVLGQVTSPGSYNIPDEQTLDILNAIAIAGGFTRLAKTSKVTVTRFTNGEAKTFQIDLDKMIKTGSTEHFNVQPNDVIIVEEKFF